MKCGKLVGLFVLSYMSYDFDCGVIRELSFVDMVMCVFDVL